MQQATPKTLHRNLDFIIRPSTPYRILAHSPTQISISLSRRFSMRMGVTVAIRLNAATGALLCRYRYFLVRANRPVIASLQTIRDAPALSRALVRQRRREGGTINVRSVRLLLFLLGTAASGWTQAVSTSQVSGTVQDTTGAAV